MTPGVWVSIAAFGFSLMCTMAGCLIWFVRLEGRVNTLKALHDQFKEVMGARHTELGDRMDAGFREMKTDIKADLTKIFDRLEGKQDKPR